MIALLLFVYFHDKKVKADNGIYSICRNSDNIDNSDTNEEDVHYTKLNSSGIPYKLKERYSGYSKNQVRISQYFLLEVVP